MTELGQLIGRINSSLRELCSKSRNEYFSVKGMSRGELEEVNSFRLIKGVADPILVEMEAKFHGEYFRNPKMTAAEAFARGRDLYPNAAYLAELELQRRELDKSKPN